MKQVRPKKNLGQHFLTDLSIAKRIADTVDACPNLPVLEVGPGMGVMTQYLVEKPRPFKVVEIDRESVAYLNEHFPKLRENILGEDFLRIHRSYLVNIALATRTAPDTVMVGTTELPVSRKYREAVQQLPMQA